MIVIVQANQTLADIALQVYGDVRGVSLLARANKLPMTAEPPAGRELFAPDVVLDNERSSYCRRNDVMPATVPSVDDEDRLRIFTEQFTPQFM